MNRKQRRALAHAARKGSKGTVAVTPQSRIKPVQEKSSRPQSRSKVSQRVKGFWSVVVALTVLFTVYEAAYQFRPQVKIERDSTLNNKDPFATQFSVSNNGRIIVTDLNFSCIVNAPPMINDVQIGGSANQLPAAEIKPGDQVVRGCGVKADHFPFNATLIFRVKYHILVFGYETKDVRFISKFDAQGIPQWFRDSN